MLKNELQFDPDEQHERRKVEQALRYFGLEDDHWAVVDESDRLGLGRRLTFDALHEVRPDVPMRLCAQRTPTGDGGTRTVRDRDVLKLVTGFRKSPLGRAFMRHCREQGACDTPFPIGMVFSVRSVPGGLVIHNMTSLDTSYPRANIAVKKHSSVRLDRYVALLKALGATKWSVFSTKPAERTTGRPDPAPRYDPGLPVHPVIRKQLGHGVEARLVALIGQVLTRRLPPELAERVQRRGGLRYAVLPQRWLRQQLGVGRRRIQQAIAWLQRHGWIHVEAGFAGAGNPNGYQLDADLQTQIDHRERSEAHG